MALKKGSRFEKGYATVVDDDGINYREIADIMSEIGFVMNHSSARNYVLRVMLKFARAFDEEWRMDLSEEKVHEIASSPQFQNVISDLLHNL
jgi:transposase-like protein